MAKGKKKGRQQAESSDDEPKQSMATAANDSDDDLKTNNAAQPPKAAKKKDKKKSKKKVDVGSDNDSDIDPLKQNVKDTEDLDNDSEDEMIVAMKPKSKKDKKKKPGFSALAVEDSDDEKPVAKPKSAFSALMDDSDNSDAGEPEPELLPKSKSKPKSSSGFAALADSDDDANVVKPEDYPDSEEDKKKKKEKKPKEKKGKKGKKAEEAPAEEEDLDKLLADMNIEIKDTGKKEKKKKKKDAKTQEDETAVETTMPAAADADKASEEATAAGDDTKAEGGEASAAADDKKKKKKKKKKDEKESTPAADNEDAEVTDAKQDKTKAGKKPTKAILQMQEALRKRLEEAKRLEEKALEDERLAEEAEKLRVQKLLEEKERAELKKQREKEKREKMKAEGKLLTKAQKQAQARAQATLQALREQGVNIPPAAGERASGDRPKRAPLIRRKKKTQEESPPKDESAEKSVEAEAETKEEPVTPSTTESLPSAAEEKKADDSGEDVRDAWDATSESEAESHPEQQAGKPDAPKAAGDPAKPSPAAAAAAAAAKKDESTEEEEESSDEEEDDSTEEESSEEEDSSDDDASQDEEIDKRERLRQKVMERIRKRREANEKNRSTANLRSPVICVLGHVDTGKTKILDYIRRTHVQDNEAGGITQQIGATMVPLDAIKEQCKAVKDFASKPLRIPGALIIDTPGHESFSNLRSRGSSLCDMAILVVDIMHGLEPQTIESINLLKGKRTPFVVALNKIDRLYDWKSNKHKDVADVLASQPSNTKQEFEKHTNLVITQFAEQGLNAALFDNNPDPKSFISLVPTSAFTGDGMGNLISLVIELTQKMLANRIAYSEELQATVLEVKAIPGLGTTIDVIVVNGQLKEGDTMVLAGHEGPFVTQIRSLLMPQPLRELRVKNAYQEFKAIQGAQGVKIAAKDLDKAIAGLNVLVAHNTDEIEFLKEEIARSLKEVMGSFKLHDKGVYVQASTLGSLEALLVFLKDSKIPYFGIRIGPVVKKDVIKASVMLEHDSQYAVILAFDVKVERDAQELADHSGVKIFSADIIYHLFDKFTAHREELRQKKREEFKNIAIFPCKLRILPQHIFKTRDPIIVGVMVEAGIVKLGTPICVPSKDNLVIGSVASIQVNHKPQETARRGEEVCLRIDNTTSDAPKLYGRHFDHTDLLCSKITRESIDACKDYFRNDLTKQDWALMVELKKTFQIL